MINPQPVHTPQSPYSNRNDGPKPVPLSVPPGQPTPSGYFSAPRVPKKPRWRKVAGIALLTLIFGGFTYGYTQYRALTGDIIEEHQGETAAILGYDPSKGKLDASKFTKAGDGRFTMAIVGVGGENHPGGTLTDSIQVISLDTLNSSATLTSIPRDLYVTANGTRSKINAVYTYAERKKKGSGGVALKEAISNVLGTKVTNYALIDFSGIEKIVDALGGIEVDVPKAINDPLYPAPDMFHYDPFSIRAGLQTLDGKTALKYVRSRKTTSDFDRSERQQLVIAAIKKKAMSLGVLTNPAKLTSLREALGSHFRTDLQTTDIRTLFDIYRQVTPEKTGGFVLDTSSTLSLLTSTTDPVAGYIAYPLLGYDKFTDIHQWFHKNNPDPLLVREGPSVTVYGNGKATAKQLEAFVQKLKDYGYAVTLAATVSTDKTTATKLVSKNPEGKPISKNYLGSLISTGVSKGSIEKTVTTDFEIVYVPATVAAKATASPKASSSPKPSPAPSASPTSTP